MRAWVLCVCVCVWLCVCCLVPCLTANDCSALPLPRTRILRRQFGFASHALQPSEPDGTVYCLDDISKLMALHSVGLKLYHTATPSSAVVLRVPAASCPTSAPLTIVPIAFFPLLQGIRIQVTGYTQPDCPHSIAIRISASRAAMVALYIACRLCGLAVSSRNLQVTRNILADFPQIQILGRREGDSGRAVKWGHEGTFRAFDVDFWSDSEDGYSDSEDDEPDSSSSSEGEEEDNVDEDMQEDDQGSVEEEAEGEAAAAAADDGGPRSSSRRDLVSVMAPEDWDVHKPLEAAAIAAQLPYDCSSCSTKWHRVSGAALRERLMEHLGRIQQVAGHNTAPKNSNWVSLSLSHPVCYSLSTTRFFLQK